MPASKVKKTTKKKETAKEDNLEQLLQDLFNKAGQYISDNPRSSALIGLGIGVFAGIAIKKIFSRDHRH